MGKPRVQFTREEDVAAVAAALEVKRLLAASIERHGASSVVIRLANVLAIEDENDGLPHGSDQLRKAYELSRLSTWLELSADALATPPRQCWDRAPAGAIEP